MVSLKLSLTSIDLLAILRELKSILISTRIENVYNLDDWGFLFRIHTSGGNLDLLLEPGKRLNITTFKYPLPASPSSHAMNMRRLISNAIIKSIEQVDLDRIARFTLERSGRLLNVYFELLGEGNIIITDESGKILYALHQKTMRDRTIRTGAIYQPPPVRGASVYSEPKIDEIRSQKVSIIRSLTRHYNLPPEFVEESLARSSIDPNLPSSEVSEALLKTFLKSARSAIEEITSSPLKPHIIVKDQKRLSVQPIEFVSLSYERIPFDSFNAAVDEYFATLVSAREGERRRLPKEEEIEALEGVLNRQKASLKELEERRQRDREIGELIISNLADIQDLIDHVVEMRRKGAEWEEIVRTSPMKILKIDRSKGLLTALVNDKEVLIDFKCSATENANRYFSGSKDASRKLQGLTEAIRETEKKINELRQGLLEVAQPMVLKSMKKEWYERFRWTFSSQGFLIIGGKDASQNEILVKKYMENKDIFAHSDAPGGSVVIVKSRGEEIPNDTKEEAVAFAVVYSRAWRAGLGAADGYWVRADQVTKTPPAGEYLGKGAFMIYGERNYVRNIPLVIFLGVQIADGAFKVIVGNESFVKKTCVSYVKLVPGEPSGSALIKKIKSLLVQRADQSLSQLISAIPEGEIAAQLPPGGSLPT
ncbi:MAG: ribosome rescue protein RqcH [Candidatus Methanomethyliaceae archaeon]|nr:ribosome rescue protein RqcH [Candidatus Methanomethyliaceae archaeon]